MRAARSDRRMPLRGWLSALGIAIGIFLASGGLVLLCAPASGGRCFGRDGPTADYGFHRATGVRQLYLGVMVCVVWWTDRARALRVLLTTLGSVPVADAVIALWSGSTLTKASEHLLGLGVPAVGLGVLRAVRRSRDRGAAESLERAP